MSLQADVAIVRQATAPPPPFFPSAAFSCFCNIFSYLSDVAVQSYPTGSEYKQQIIADHFSNFSSCRVLPVELVPVAIVPQGNIWYYVDFNEVDSLKRWPML